MATSNIRIVGLEAGRGFTKAYDGDTHHLFPSVVSAADGSSDTPASASLGNEVGMGAEIDDESYRLGDSTQAHPPAPDRAAYFARFVRPLLLAAAAATTDRECPLGIVTGLPVADYAQHHERLADQIRGYHKVHLKPVGTPPVIHNLHIRKLMVFPAPMGTFARLAMGADGRIIHREYADAKIGIVDVGHQTTDAMIVDRLRYCNRGAGTLAVGAARCLDAIARRLRQKSGVDVDPATLFQGLKLGYVKIEDQEYRLNRLKGTVFGQAAADIAERVNYLWRDDWDLDHIVISGGGGHLLAGALGDRFAGEVHLLENPIDARMNNTMGYYLLGVNAWGASSLCRRDFA